MFEPITINGMLSVMDFIISSSTLSFETLAYNLLG